MRIIERQRVGTVSVVDGEVPGSERRLPAVLCQHGRAPQLQADLVAARRGGRDQPPGPAGDVGFRVHLAQPQRAEVSAAEPTAEAVACPRTGDLERHEGLGKDMPPEVEALTAGQVRCLR